MMTDNSPSSQAFTQKRGWRRFRPLFILVAFLASGWSGLWFYSFYQVQRAVTVAMNEGLVEGLSLRCEDLEYGGFPFRLSVVCVEGELASRVDDQARLSVSFQSARIHATALNPNHIVMAIKAPIRFEPSWSQPLRADFSDMRLSFSPNDINQDIRLSASDMRVRSEGFSYQPDAAPIAFDSHFKHLLVNLASTVEIGAYAAAELSDFPAMTVAFSGQAEGVAVKPGTPSLTFELMGRLGSFWPVFINRPDLAAKAETTLVLDRADVVTEDQARARVQLEARIGSDGFPDVQGQLVMVNPVKLSKNLRNVWSQSTAFLLGLTFLGTRPSELNGEKAIALTFKTSGGKAEVGRQAFDLPLSLQMFAP